MFICRDITERYLLSVYWEKKEFFVVVKEVDPLGELKQRSAVRYSREAAHELMAGMSNGNDGLLSVRVDALTATAIIGRIAEGLRDPSRRRTPSRISPEMWN